MIDREHPDKSYHGRVPSQFRKVIKGNTYPIVAVTDNQGKEAILGYSAQGNNAKSVKRLARDLKKKLKENPELVTGPSSSSESDEESPKLLTESREWTNAQGKTITAAVAELNEGSVVFVMKGGRRVTYPREKLSSESQVELAELD